MPFYSTIFSTMHKIKTRPYINKLRHRSVPNDIENEYKQFQGAIK